MVLLGLTGTLGAGKGTVVKRLVEKHGFTHLSVRSYLIGDLTRSGIPVNRDTMTFRGNELRAKYGAAYLVEELLRIAQLANVNTVIESIRTVGEADMLHGHEGALLVGVDAPIESRFERIRARGSETDDILFETFKYHEEREMENNNPTKQNIRAVMKVADIVLDNSGTEVELFAKVDAFISNVYESAK